MKKLLPRLLATLLLAMVSSLQGNLLRDAEPVGNGWWSHPQLGAFYTAERTPGEGWLWHETFRWTWVPPSSSAADFHVWSQAHGWMWTSESTAPHTFAYDEEAWYYPATTYLQNAESSGWAFNFATERWTWRDLPIGISPSGERTDTFFRGEFRLAPISGVERDRVAYRLEEGAGFSLEDGHLLSLSSEETGLHEATVRVIDKVSGRSVLVRRAFRILAGEVVLQGEIGPEGGTLTDQWQEIVLTIPPGAVASRANFRLLRGLRANGLPSYRVETEEDVELAELPRLAVPVSMASVTAAETQGGEAILQPMGAMVTPSPVPRPTPANFLRISNFTFVDVDTRLNRFLSANRLPRNSNESFSHSWRGINLLGWPVGGSLRTDIAEASRLRFRGNPSRNTEGLIPIILIHGYSPEMEVNWDGGWDMVDDYWVHLPEILSSMEDGTGHPLYAVYEFQWRTNSRFNDAAADLAEAINFVAGRTGNRVHLVAHSFGGLVARAYLQDLATDTPYRDNVASLVTIGTPHGGIFGSAGARHGVWLPDGQQGLLGGVIPLNVSSSGYQAGSAFPSAFRYYRNQADPIGKDLRRSLGLSEVGPGEIPAALAQAPGMPNIPTLALIGLYYKEEAQNRQEGGLLIGSTAGGVSTQFRAQAGDGLISFDSQRFHPGWVGQDLVYQSGEIRERLIQHPPLLPGEVTTERLSPNSPRGGYAHTEKNRRNTGLFQTVITWENHSHHRVFLLLDDWLSQFTPDNYDPNVIEMRAQIVDGQSGAPVSGAIVRVMRDHSSLAESVSDEDGNVSFPDVPFFAFTRYILGVEAQGYRLREFDRDILTGGALEQGSFNFGRLELTPDTTEPILGNLQVTVVNATTGVRLSSAEVTLFNAFGIPLRHALSDINGRVNWSDLPPGNYRVAATRENFRESAQSIFMAGLTTTSTTVALNELLPVGRVRIVLTWGANPRDLDSHLVRYSENGGFDYHIFYASRTGLDGDFLDTDNVSGFGPETITIQNLDPTKTYVYVVHRFAGTGTLAGSNATVEVTFGDSEPRRFIVPTQGAGDYWRVFTIQNGILQPCSGSCIIADRNTALSLDPGAGLLDYETFSPSPPKAEFH